MEVIIVCGAPASGKTSYVKKNMSRGDFVVDVDAIRAAVSFTDDKMPVDNLTGTIFDIRDFIYSRIEQNQITAPRCWIIAGLPKKADRDNLAARLRGRVVFLETSEDECIRRAITDNDRSDKDFQIKIITEYFTTLYADKKMPLRESRDKTRARYTAMLYKYIND
ncbi:MAG: ATP-binding protein [Lachnospiraceae bacterium]|nr:ATP-binding protein [Lachnospiraceae bacterium]